MNDLIKGLTLREKIAQTAVFRHHIMDTIPKYKNYNEYFAENPVGFTWLMRHPKEFYKNLETFLGNPELEGSHEQFLTDYFNTINKYSSIPVMPVCDASQGVSYLFPDRLVMPSAAAVGATNDPEIAYNYGNALGQDLYAIGFRWLWSPTVDNAGVFKELRTFSSYTESGNKLAAAFIKGVQDAGVATCAKHFPGADPYEFRDSHFCSTAYKQSLEHWWATQAREFQACIDAGVDSVMIGHKSFAAVDDSLINGNIRPCSISYKVVTELLKGEMGFKGVVVSDDISMKALTAVCDYKQLYVELLNAGIDAVLGPMHLDYVDIVEQAVKDGRIAPERIDDAATRVLTMKKKYGVLDMKEFTTPTEERKAEIREKIVAVNESVAAKGLTLQVNKAGLVPIDKNKIKKVKIVYIGYSELCYKNLKYVEDEFARHGATCDIQEGMKPEDVKTLKDYDLIVYATYINMHAPKGGPYFFGKECEMMFYVMTEEREKSVGVSFGYPSIYFNYFSAAPTFVNCYGMTKETMEGFVKGMYGEIQFTDYTPFPINPITRNNEL